MSLYKIDGFVLSVNELYTWVAGFVNLYRKDLLRRKEIPEGIVDIMHRERDDEQAAQSLLEFLDAHQEHMAMVVHMVKDGMGDLAIERESGSRKP